MSVSPFNQHRIERMTTWKVLEEVDKIMAHVPNWKKHNWNSKENSNRGKFDIDGHYHRRLKKKR